MSTDAVQRVVMLSLHTSPLAQAGMGDAGGLNVYVDALSQALVAQGVEVDIVTTDLDLPTVDTAAQEGGHDFSTTLTDGRRLHSLHVPRRCRQDKTQLLECLEPLSQRAADVLRAATSTTVDVVHSHYWLSGLAGLTLAKELDASPVHTMHTIGAIKIERDPATQEDPRRHDAEARIAAEAAALTANTERERLDLERLFEVPRYRISLVKPGVDLQIFHPPAAGDPRHLPRGDRPLELTFAGRLQPHKGPQVVVKALAHLRRDHPELTVHLTVAGRQSGPDAIDIAALAAEHGVDDVVVHRKPLPHDDLANLFRRSDAVLVPSYSESFGLVALEAMACGTPVLAHRVGGLAELVRHNSTGRLIDSLDPADWAAEIAGLSADPTRWRQFSHHAAELARGYSWEATAVQAMSAYSHARQNTLSTDQPL